MDNDNEVKVEVVQAEVVDDDDEIKKAPKKTFRDSLYGNITVSVKTMNKIIIGIVVLTIIAIVVGALQQ